MRSHLGWSFLILAFLFSVTGIIHHGADFANPVSVGDAFLYMLVIVGIIIIEVRDAARWIVKQIRGEETSSSGH